MRYTLSQIASITKGIVFGDGEKVITMITIDSRSVTMNLPSQTMFVALTTGARNGHLYVKGAIESGIGAVLISEEGLAHEDGVQVDDTLEALHRLAEHHRNELKSAVIGITGSNGKTIVKEWLAFLLSRQFKVGKSPKSYNSKIGVPISILGLEKANDYALIEAGISETNEMAILEKMVKPQIGIFTNLGDAHSQGFRSDREKFLEKWELFKTCQLVIVGNINAIDNSWIEEFITTCNTPPQVVSWGQNIETNVILKEVGSTTHGSTKLKVEVDNIQRDVEIPFVDQASIHNALTVLSFLVATQDDWVTYLPFFNELQPVDIRLVQQAGHSGNVIVEDYYNSDLVSVNVALDYLNKVPLGLVKTVILSDFEHYQEDDPGWVDLINEVLLRSKVDSFVGVGEKWEKHRDRIKIENKVFVSNAELLNQYLVQNPLSNTLILLKGARKYQFEKVAAHLIQKKHKTRLEVNLSALGRNYTWFKSFLNPNIKTMAMVKALSYGSGTYEIANELAHLGVNYLAVAYADEGLMLRSKGIRKPIMVMNANPTDASIFLKHELEPVIYNLTKLKQWAQLMPYENSLKFHLELDTGMHRLGFQSAELPSFIAAIKALNPLELGSVFSHFAGADDDKNDQFSQAQIERFNTMVSLIESELGIKVLKHLSNTAGILRFKDAHFDMVRLGVGLYGIDPTSQNRDLELVSSLYSEISQVKVIPPGDGVSYGLGSKSTQKRRIAIIPIGYADGFDRRFSDGKGWFIIHGQKASVVGKVCMDMTMCDVTQIPEAMELDEVEVFTSSQMIKELSEAIGVIPYELLAGISSRVSRVFTAE